MLLLRLLLPRLIPPHFSYWKTIGTMSVTRNEDQYMAHVVLEFHPSSAVSPRAARATSKTVRIKRSSSIRCLQLCVPRTPYHHIAYQYAYCIIRGICARRTARYCRSSTSTGRRSAHSQENTAVAAQRRATSEVAATKYRAHMSLLSISLFLSARPPAVDLAFCNEYRGSTCCDVAT